MENMCTSLYQEKQKRSVWKRLKSHYFARGTLTTAEALGIPGNQEPQKLSEPACYFPRADFSFSR